MGANGVLGVSLDWGVVLAKGECVGHGLGLLRIPKAQENRP